MASISIGFAMVTITSTRYATTFGLTIVGSGMEKDGSNTSFPVFQEACADLLNGPSDGISTSLDLDDPLS